MDVLDIIDIFLTNEPIQYLTLTKCFCFRTLLKPFIHTTEMCNSTLDMYSCIDTAHKTKKNLKTDYSNALL